MKRSNEIIFAKGVVSQSVGGSDFGDGGKPRLDTSVRIEKDDGNVTGSSCSINSRVDETGRNEKPRDLNNVIVRVNSLMERASLTQSNNLAAYMYDVRMVGTGGKNKLNLYYGNDYLCRKAGRIQ